MNKKWFAFRIFMLMFSSVVTFLYLMALYISPFFMMPGISKELMVSAILFGIFVGSTIIYFAVKSLYNSGTKVKIIPGSIASAGNPNNDLPPLNKPEFDKLLDDIKLTKIGPEMMNHVKECQLCTEMSMALNNQVNKHIEEANKLV